ncbi:MAG: M50 family metallopeptidase [Planctomycetaceae bacterium]
MTGDPKPISRRSPPAVIWFCMAGVLSSWLLMQAVHEFGHVLHAWCSGGSVQRVVLHPLAISRTDVRPNPSPRFVAWGGFVWGVAVPLLVWAAGIRWRWRIAGCLAFFAGFCLIANGAYLTTGVRSPVGDTRDLLRHGDSPWLMFAAGAFGIAGGLWIWHRLDGRLRGSFAEKLARRDVVVVTGVLLAVVIVEFVLSMPLSI